MKIDLNIKEFLALYGLLERSAFNADKQLVEVHHRMRSMIISVLQEAEKDQFERWFDITAKKVQHLENQNENIKRADQVDEPDDDNVTTYPRIHKPQNNRRKRS